MLRGGDRGLEPGSSLGGKGACAVPAASVRTFKPEDEESEISALGNTCERSAACLERRYLRLEISKCDNRTQHWDLWYYSLCLPCVAMDMEMEK